MILAEWASKFCKAFLAIFPSMKLSYQAAGFVAAAGVGNFVLALLTERSMSGSESSVIDSQMYAQSSISTACRS